MFRGAEYGRSFILTCAHNLCWYSVNRDKLILHKNMVGYKVRIGPNIWIEKYTSFGADQLIIHPKYPKFPHEQSGYDIAMIIMDPEEGEEGPQYNTDNYNSAEPVPDTYTSFITEADAKAQLVEKDVEVAGYPVDKNKLNWMYTHTGPVKEILKNEESGGYTFSYEVDTTPGQSGSAVVVVDEGFVEWDKAKHRFKRQDYKKKICIGIHTGHRPEDGCNVGTLITPEIA